MSLANSRLVSLSYGADGRFSCEIEADRVVASRPAPQPNPRLADDLRSALAEPLDFPPLEQAVIPDDRIALALDRHTPESPALVAAVWQVLAKRRVEPENVVVIQPAGTPGTNGQPLADPRSNLPDGVRDRVRWKVHDPVADGECAYLASAVSSERIYLSRDVTDADVVVSLGEVAYDPLIGYRGTNSIFYPGLSSPEAFERARGQGHSELGPDDDRPLRQLMDEVGWLLGTQFSVQVIPAAAGGATHVLAGAADSVLRRGKQLLADEWLLRLDSRPELVVAAVDRDAGGHGWEQVAAALATSRNLVARGGKVLILSELAAEPGAGLELIRECESPRDALKPLRTQAPPDLVAATQFAAALDWADVYLLSRLDSDLVEELFMVPVETEREARRFLDHAGTCIFLESAQHVFGEICERACEGSS